MNNNKSNSPQNHSNISPLEDIINSTDRIEASEDTMDIEPFTSSSSETSHLPSSIAETHTEVFDDQNLDQSCNTEEDAHIIEQSNHVIKWTNSIKKENTDETCDGKFSDDSLGFLREIRLERTNQPPLEMNGVDPFVSFEGSNQELLVPIDIFTLNTENRERSAVSERSRRPPSASSQISSMCSISEAHQMHDLFKSKTQFCPIELHQQELSESKYSSSRINGNAKNGSRDGSSVSEKRFLATFEDQCCARAEACTMTSKFDSKEFDRSTNDDANSKKRMLAFATGEGVVCEKESMNKIGEELPTVSDFRNKKLLKILEYALLICDLPEIDGRH